MKIIEMKNLRNIIEASILLTVLIFWGGNQAGIPRGSQNMNMESKVVGVSPYSFQGTEGLDIYYDNGLYEKYLDIDGNGIFNNYDIGFLYTENDITITVMNASNLVWQKKFDKAQRWLRYG